MLKRIRYRLASWLSSLSVAVEPTERYLGVYFYDPRTGADCDFVDGPFSDDRRGRCDAAEMLQRWQAVSGDLVPRLAPFSYYDQCVLGQLTLLDRKIGYERYREVLTGHAQLSAIV